MNGVSRFIPATEAVRDDLHDVAGPLRLVNPAARLLDRVGPAERAEPAEIEVEDEPGLLGRGRDGRCSGRLGGGSRGRLLRLPGCPRRFVRQGGQDVQNPSDVQSTLRVRRATAARHPESNS